MAADSPPAVRPQRADARRNHKQILAAARDLVIEHGPGVPLEDVALRAGVGYRHPLPAVRDRPTLLRAVVVDALERTRLAAEAAHRGHGRLRCVRPLPAAALDARVSAVIPLVLDRLEGDELRPAREAAAEAVERIIDAAHADGTLTRGVTFGDVATLLIRLARPLPGRYPAGGERPACPPAPRSAGRRSAGSAGTPLGGPRLELAELRAPGRPGWGG